MWYKNLMKNIIKLILNKLSRLIYYIHRTLNYITPDEIKFKKKSELKLKLEKELLDETYNYFKKYFEKSLIFNDRSDRNEIRKYAIQSSLLNDKNQEYYYLEFGVWQGKSSNFFSKFINKLYCFDSFEGLKEDWIGTSYSKGFFNLDKKIPNLNSNVQPIVGWVEDTLEDFLKKHNPKINFIHLDMDNYIPTKFTLEKIKPYLVKNSILIFDQLYNYQGWKNGEFKALKEVFKEDDFEYKAFNLYGKQCVIQIK
mgnify:CR=1 FL=1